MEGKQGFVTVVVIFSALVILFWNFSSRNTNVNQAKIDTDVYMAKLARKWYLKQNNRETKMQRVHSKSDTNEPMSLHGYNSHRSDLVSNEPTSQDAVLPGDPLTGPPANKQKTILFWNKYHNSYDYGIGLGNASLAFHGCPVHQCSFTADKSQIKTVDAVVIHGFLDDPPAERSENQIYVFHMFESPIRSASRKFSALPKWQGVFNLTFTYMYDEDTDISAGHGMAVRLPEPRPNALPQMDVIKNKKKMVLWIVSNCHPLSGRMEYAEELAKYVEVDVVGRCGNLSCPVSSTANGCISALSKDYLFYLSFENSYCLDYYTEKIMGPLIHDMVPVTMGRVDYARYLPPHSFIDANDYSPKQLAKKMLHLKEHIQEYMEYFQWKQDYTMDGHLKTQGYCRLCEILHTTDYPYKSKFSIAQYWSVDKLCSTKTEHLEQLGLSTD